MSFFITLISLLFLIFLAKKFDFGHDHSCGEQKFHIQPTPRTGGLALAFAVIISLFFDNHENIFNFIFPIIFLLIPAFYEDIHSGMKPSYRLLLILFAVVLLVILNNLEIKNFGVFYLDHFLDVPVVNIIFTVLTLSMLINAFNIIDGFNGLLSGFSLIILASIAYISNNLGEVYIYELSVISIMSVVAFLILNFPYGKIFLGDSGAYFLGTLIGFLLINLIINPMVSTWFALAIVIYPVYEIVFSIFRKKFFFNSPAMEPDSFHLHMLVHKNLINCEYFKNKIFCNSLTSVIIWLLSLFSIIPSLLWYDESLILFLTCLIFMFLYTVLYLKLLSLEKK